MRPNIYFSQSIDERSWHVWRPVVKLGEHQGAFFFYVDVADADERRLITPPRGLYGKEFLELDHRDVFQLMDFQKRWGPITGLRAQPNVTFDYGTVPNVELNESFYGEGTHPVFHPDGITQSLFLYEGMGDCDIIAKERFGIEPMTLGKVVERNWRKKRSGKAKDTDIIPCHVASVEEVAEAVCDAQVAIRAITRTLSDGYSEKDWKEDKQLVRECVRYCNAVLTGSVAAVDIIEDGNREGVCTLMQYLFICLAKGVMLNNAFRFCQNPECRQLFTPREYDRRTDSKYCCNECQIRAKYLRAIPTGKKAKVVQESEGIDETGQPLIVSWSTSNIPVRTLRRDQYDSCDDECESQPSGALEQLLTAQSFVGLSTGSVRTASILQSLKQKTPYFWRL